MDLYSLVYSSSATEDFSQAELSALLDQAQQKNTQCGITGMLIYYQREFMQVLEGDKAVVLTLYKSICHDGRNRQNYLMWEEPITQRQFGSWSMAYLAPAQSADADRPGYSDFLKAGFSAPALGERISAGKRFLSMVRADFLRHQREIAERA